MLEEDPKPRQRRWVLPGAHPRQRRHAGVPLLAHPRLHPRRARPRVGNRHLRLARRRRRAHLRRHRALRGSVAAGAACARGRGPLRASSATTSPATSSGTSCRPPSAATSLRVTRLSGENGEPPTRSPRWCSSGSPAGSSCPVITLVGLLVNPGLRELGTATALAVAVAAGHPGRAGSCSCSPSATQRRRALRRPTRAGAASPARSTSASTGCAATRPPPSRCSPPASPTSWPSCCAASAPPRPSASRRGRAHRAARLLPGRAHRPGPAHRHLAASASGRRLRAVPAPARRAPRAGDRPRPRPLRLNLVVSLPGAPSFALGGPEAPARCRRQRASVSGGLTEVDGP